MSNIGGKNDAVEKESIKMCIEKKKYCEHLKLKES